MLAIRGDLAVPVPARSTTISTPIARQTCLFCGGELAPGVFACPHCGCSRPTASRYDVPLAGRTRELALLRHHIDRVVSGYGGVVGIAGTAGIGKTRLVEAGLDYAKERRCYDFIIRGFEPNADLPYWTLIEALHGALGTGDAADGDLAATGITHLLRALQSANDAPQRATAGFETRDAGVNTRIYEANAAVIRALTAARPLVVIVDDLQWIDVPTLNLMRYTVRLAKTLPLLMICAYRDDGEGPTRWRPLLEDAAREGLFTELRLDGLDEPAARRLALATAAAPLSDRSMGEVLRLAEGNPFYVTQLARSFERTPAEAGRATLPAALRGFVEQRLAGLSAGCHALLQAIALVGRECPLDLLTRIAPPRTANADAGAALRDMAAALDEALVTHVLVERESGGSPRYDFTNALLREASAREINAIARAELHLRIAEALHERRLAGGREPAGEIAEHYLGARPLAPAARVLDYARAAADEALALGSYEQGARFLGAAIELLQQQGGRDATAGTAPVRDRRPGTAASVPDWSAGDPGWGGDPARNHTGRAAATSGPSAPPPDAVGHAGDAYADEVAGMRARLMEAYGAGGDIDAAEREAGLAIAYWRARGDARAEAEVHAALAEQLNPRLRPHDVSEHAEAGMALLGEERSPLAARLRFLRAHARYMQDDPADLIPVADWLAAGAFDPPEPAAEVWHRLLRVLWHIWNVPEADRIVALCREAVEHTRRMGDRRAQAMARLWEAEVLNRDARPREALLALDEARILARDSGSASMLVDAGALRAEALLQLARWDELEQVVDETLPMLVRLRSTYFGYTLVAAHSWSRRLRGLPWTAPDGLEVRFRDSQLFVAAYRANFAREVVESAQSTAAGRAAVEADERTARLLDWLTANVPRSGTGLAWATAGIPLLGSLAIAGRRDDVATRYAAAKPFGRFLQSATYGPLELARAASLLKRWDEAESHLDIAMRQATESGLRTALARTLVERGAMYRARGRRGDRGRAAEVLRRAAEMCAEIGLKPDEARARAMLADLDAPAPSALPAGLTPREAEVIRLLATGATNRGIAEALTISEKTVEQHLLNIYQKLGVDSRARAVAFAYANGLADR
jgi:DNA-binding CsgD family transcriptional regulator